ncbi:MAG: winged helix DNA-binding domain-containing protein [Chloroflexi bacterium]|nr:winged helix DNA-binding domain-containing protein [Chloroflexota bacterium]MCI0645160.1 winged helix DNA-binding domain-containing protein [Chloroflexota bacterium]MCI0725640.1 winged helix DNA-binding domain-containing protein [Chloroflexota bacterium]
MLHISAERYQAYQARVFRLAGQPRLASKEEALAFVNERGFVYFWPIKDVVLPSLWAAVAGDRPVADAHDDPGHVTWGWKDEMLGSRQWYYGKILRGKATMIALDVAPYFYALSENYGDPENDYIQLYEDGLLTREARLIYEALLREGPLDTVNMRRVIRMTNQTSNSPFERGLVALQRDFKILPVGVAEAGAWRYSFIYDLVHRYYPELPEKARPIGRREAQEKLVDLYLVSVGAATAGDVRRLFQWRPAEVDRALERLAATGRTAAGYQVEGRPGEHFISATLLDESNG